MKEKQEATENVSGAGQVVIIDEVSGYETADWPFIIRRASNQRIINQRRLRQHKKQSFLG